MIFWDFFPNLFFLVWRGGGGGGWFCISGGLKKSCVRFCLDLCNDRFHSIE